MQLQAQCEDHASMVEGLLRLERIKLQVSESIVRNCGHRSARVGAYVPQGSTACARLSVSRARQPLSMLRTSQQGYHKGHGLGEHVYSSACTHSRCALAHGPGQPPGQPPGVEAQVSQCNLAHSISHVLCMCIRKEHVRMLRPPSHA